jgi:ABC-type polar amino acid transport system ATPase subunit
LLDEPAGGVNLTLINEIAEKIRSLNKDGKTFLIVEHNMEFVMQICDRRHGHAPRRGPRLAARLKKFASNPDGPGRLPRRRRR